MQEIPRRYSEDTEEILYRYCGGMVEARWRLSGGALSSVDSVSVIIYMTPSLITTEFRLQT